MKSHSYPRIFGYRIHAYLVTRAAEIHAYLVTISRIFGYRNSIKWRSDNGFSAPPIVPIEIPIVFTDNSSRQAVDSAALMENASRLPQGLDNCCAVTHTDAQHCNNKRLFSFFKGEKMLAALMLMLFATSLAAAATPEQEMQLEAKKLLDITGCKF